MLRFYQVTRLRPDKRIKKKKKKAWENTRVCGVQAGNPVVAEYGMSTERQRDMIDNRMGVPSPAQETQQENEYGADP